MALTEPVRRKGKVIEFGVERVLVKVLQEEPGFEWI